MVQFNLSQIEKKVPLLPRTRVTQPSALLQRMQKLGDGHSFTIKEVTLKEVSATVYATAKRAGIKVSLRQDGEDVRVWRTGEIEKAA